MTIRAYYSVSPPMRINLLFIALFLLFATSVDVAAQQPSISVRDATVVEGNSGTSQATFVIALSAPASQSVSCSFATANGTATAGSDYVSASGNVTFAVGESEKPVVVLVNGDTVDETQETFFLDISNVQNATVGSSRGTGFINDDDGPTITINDVSVTEGNSGTKPATYTLTLSGSSVEAIAVRVVSTAGTATAASDYNSIDLVVIFQPGIVTRTFDVTIIGDTNPEPNETFVVNITEAFGTTPADGQGAGTIVDDDISLMLEELGPVPQQAAAFESFLLTRDPFKVKSVATFFNLPPGQNTLVMVFAQNLTLNQGEPPSTVIVNLVDANNQSFDVPASDVREVPNVDFKQVLFRLPDTLAPGTCKVTIKLHGQTSNLGNIRIAP
ncbi:MAG TPA: Calx-beta domain-containing protein [Pyrinomonadaceae bacterium]|nr:Calx-beta domain-containing protein [Pyrinomonadaceae bacterium]